MKNYLFATIAVVSLAAFGSYYYNSEYATCTGASNCKACKNCKYCKHCSQKGKSCGVCS
ncbi:MAG: hypothetical protein LBE34_02455 [Flavobacteriaceae bacterium]|nr:hypothetical protein [Flavobacteriaceae bacterium]